jgi:hypothetical protein
VNETSDYLQANSVIFDFFPASLEINDQRLGSDQLRIIVTDRYIIAWNDVHDRIYTEPITGFTRVTYKEYLITVGDSIIKVKKTQGCGCGSQLKSFHPFQGIPFAPRF